MRKIILIVAVSIVSLLSAFEANAQSATYSKPGTSCMGCYETITVSGNSGNRKVYMTYFGQMSIDSEDNNFLYVWQIGPNGNTYRYGLYWDAKTLTCVPMDKNWRNYSGEKDIYTRE